MRVFDLLKGGFFHVARIKAAEMPRSDSQPGMVPNHAPSGGPIVEPFLHRLRRFFFQGVGAIQEKHQQYDGHDPRSDAK